MFEKKSICNFRLSLFQSLDSMIIVHQIMLIFLKLNLSLAHFSHSMRIWKINLTNYHPWRAHTQHKLHSYLSCACAKPIPGPYGPSLFLICINILIRFASPDFLPEKIHFQVKRVLHDQLPFGLCQDCWPKCFLYPYFVLSKVKCS